MKYPWEKLKNKIEANFAKERNLKSTANTAEGWYEIEKNAKTNHPFLYYFCEFLTDVEIKIERLYDFFYWPILYYKNAIRDKTHVIQTGLPKGKWYDKDTKIFLGLMNEIVDFVEREQGIEHYEKDINFLLEEGSDSYERNKEQYDTEMKIYGIYKWYKEELPKEEKEIEEMRDEYHKLRDDRLIQEGYDDKTIISRLLIRGNEDVESNKLFKAFIDREHKLEEKKTEMLHSVIDVKHSLWT